MKPILTTHEVAHLMGIHPFTVGRHIDEGLLKGFKTAGGHRRIQATEVIRHLRERALPIPPELADAGGDGGALKLLVVDDDAAVLRALKRAFKRAAPQVQLTTTTSGMEALLMLGDLKPDGLLIDVVMPGLDGFELCERVLAYPTLKDTLKVVTMTAVLKTDVMGSALRAGAVACLEKPVDPKKVVELISPQVEVAKRARVKRAG